MSMCPLCNGFEAREILCPNCGTIMTDEGRTTDYLDDYSAYMEIDTMKLFDGVLHSLERHECVHEYSCPNCLHEESAVIKE
ncbi:hypothetical protein J9317_05470 [Metabacillus sp. KIGAM252]|uniref:Uncharacterized protein n=1 Tax=Metabacillus flavus TaxID=2823519 RepID=A0ABS5LC36_9BACI|nr:hypothetical protein [Metabacillus flavus]MBS2968204.1 hypothetical protein [Metabacillus flavus]